MTIQVLCDYCGNPAKLVTGACVYPGRPELADKALWLCTRCNAWVGCHPNTEKPLGRLANAKLRRAKMAAHAAFDPLWHAKRRRDGCSKGKARGLGYRWLAAQLEIDPKVCHIGMFDVSTCERVVAIIAALKTTKAADL